MHVTEFIQNVSKVFEADHSIIKDGHVFVPVDKDLNVVPEKSGDMVTSIKFIFLQKL